MNSQQIQVTNEQGNTSQLFQSPQAQNRNSNQVGYQQINSNNNTHQQQIQNQSATRVAQANRNTSGIPVGIGTMAISSVIGGISNFQPNIITSTITNHISQEPSQQNISNLNIHGLNSEQIRTQIRQQINNNNIRQNMLHNRGGSQAPVNVTQIHHSQGIAQGSLQINGPSNISSNYVGGGALGQVGALIVQSGLGNGSNQSYNELMNQIGGLNYAAQAQAQAQAQAILNAQQNIQNNAVTSSQAVHHMNVVAAHQLAQAQRAQQIVGQIQQSINNQAAQFHHYNRQIHQHHYGSEAEDGEDGEDPEDSGDLDSESEIQGKFHKNGQYTSEEDEFEFPKLIPIRASTAPPRPLTEIEEFRRSSDFLLLENTVMMSDHLKQRPDEKYDLDSEDGQRACKRFLNQIERLCERFKAICATRKYREQFSKAYKVLYKEGSLCYLTEILDSAQEGFPYLWVNGEKYVFSQDVLEAGRKLFQQFKIIQQIIRNIYERIMEEVNITVLDVLEDMGKNLQEFDHTWVAYEQIYVLELMLIEADARRFITEAIETEKELTAIEQREKSRGRIFMDTHEYNSKRSKVIEILGKINSVANPEGMGRDDLTNDILLAAEGIFRRVSPHQSKAVRVLAERIKKTFLDFRNLLKKYEQNIEVVDPQLKNNVELVEILVEFENTWTYGLTYFMDNKKCHQLIHFSSVIEATGEKHKSFAEQLESRESEIFFIIPSLLILKSLEGDDKDICSFFNPDMFEKKTIQGQQLVNLRKNYQEGQSKMGAFDYYNLIEKCLLEVQLSSHEKKLEAEHDVQNKVVKEIKGLAMCLSRFKPADWNKFLDVVLK